jgi:parallel beta-helix repeat protein
MVNTLKKTALLVAIFLLFISCSVATLPLPFVQAQTTVHVYPGDSIQYAIDVLANLGDTIFVHPGTYIGTVNIDKPVTMRSERGPRCTTIDGDWLDTTVKISSSDVQVIGFTIIHGGSQGQTTSAGSGIDVQGDRCVIRGNIITANEAHGIRLEEVDEARVVGNVISENMGGLGGYSCERSRIAGNTIRANYDGIWLSSCHDNAIGWNRVSDHDRFGMYLWGSNRNVIYGNRVFRSGESGIETSVSSDNTIKDNVVFDSAVYDLETDNPSNNVWINNLYGTRNW